MKISPGRRLALPASALVLAGCVAAGATPNTMPLTPAQCRDLTAIRSNAPPTHEQNLSELAALREAGYDPSRWFDPYYPDDLQAAERQVDRWYRAQCPQAKGE